MNLYEAVDRKKLTGGWVFPESEKMRKHEIQPSSTHFRTVVNDMFAHNLRAVFPALYFCTIFLQGPTPTIVVPSHDYFQNLLRQIFDIAPSMVALCLLDKTPANGWIIYKEFSWNLDYGRCRFSAANLLSGRCDNIYNLKILIFSSFSWFHDEYGSNIIFSTKWFSALMLCEGCQNA